MASTVRRLMGVLFSISILTACGGGGLQSEVTNAVAESAYCTPVSTTNSITVTSNAYYYYRATDINLGLIGNPVSRGIAYAEVVVKNSAGTVVQCSYTGVTGGISFQINNVPDTYTIQVNSRADHSYLKASVLSDPTSNAVYSITSTFTLTGADASQPTKTAPDLNAYARISESPTLAGAAFHILYNFHLANKYIREETATPTFVAPKVVAYWKQGFNPGAYVGVSGGLSFYLQGQRELYILGGRNGNTKTTDTDHFDDSVIIHEYGHFLEDVYGKATSPGGSHNGHFIIDPRLAWSEGWANFLQGAIVTANDPSSKGQYYIDTVGYSSDTVESGEVGGLAIKFVLNESGATASRDPVGTDGEGTFREVSISRFLYKIITTTSIPFSSLWTVFTSTTNGMRAPSSVFTNVGLFNRYLDALVPGGATTAWNNLLANERQNKTTIDYADPVTALPPANCSAYPRNLTPVADGTYVLSSSPLVTEDRSNLLRSNDFYQYYHSSNSNVLTLSYTQVAGQTIDLDLYLYRSNYNYQEDELEASGQTTGGVVLKSDRIRALEPGGGGEESFSLAGLPAGYYLINVKANTYNKSPAAVNGTAAYTLSLGANVLCPQN